MQRLKLDDNKEVVSILTNIRRHGSSSGINIPKAYVDTLELEIGQTIEIWLIVDKVKR